MSDLPGGPVWPVHGMANFTLELSEPAWLVGRDRFRRGTGAERSAPPSSGGHAGLRAAV